MRIYSVTPIHVDEAELARRQARYDQLCPPGVTVVLEDIGEQAPTALDTAEQVRESEALVADRLRAAAPDHARQGYRRQQRRRRHRIGLRRAGENIGVQSLTSATARIAYFLCRPPMRWNLTR